MTVPAAWLHAESFVVHRGGRPVLTSAGVAAHPGRVVAICGRNGAGKSSLLEAIVTRTGLVSGLLTLGDQRLTAWSSRDVQRAGGWYWPQRGLLSPAWWLETHASLLPAPGAVTLTEALALVGGVDHLRRTAVRAMSTGERRMAEAALLLMANPKVVLADEPMAGVAPIVAEHIGEALVRLARSGSAVVLTTHHWWTAEAFADEVAWVTSGTTRSMGSPAEAAANHAFRREYLAVAGHDQRHVPRTS